MSRKFEFTESFDVTPAVAYEAMTDHDLWSKRVDDTKGRVDMEFSDLPDGGFTVSMSEGVGAQVLPGIVKKVVRGDLKIVRTDTWGPLEGDRARGTLKGGSTGLPSKVDATFALEPSGSGSKLTLKGKAEVKIPLVGGKIESMVTDMIGKLVRSESKQAREWLAEQEG
ncbi:DUF2505 domain-containing protein [Actinomycetes bacterium M1A6_2h]